MDGELHVDPETLRRGGTGLCQVATDLATRWQRFATEVQGMGDIFGDDPVGGLLGTGHQAAAQVAGQSLGSVVKALTAFGTRLQGMAASYDDTEQTNVGHFRRLDSALR